MSIDLKTVKRKAFMDGFIGFYTGKPKELEYTKRPEHITSKAFAMTGNNLRKAMDDYDRGRS